MPKPQPFDIYIYIDSYADFWGDSAIIPNVKRKKVGTASATSHFHNPFFSIPSPVYRIHLELLRNMTLREIHASQNKCTLSYIHKVLSAYAYAVGVGGGWVNVARFEGGCA